MASYIDKNDFDDEELDYDDNEEEFCEDEDVNDEYEYEEKESDEISVYSDDELNESMQSDDFQQIISKDGTIWNYEQPEMSSFRKNFIRLETGLLEPVSHLITIIDFFNYFFDDSFVNILINNTNKRLPQSESELTKDELRAFMGLLLLFGVLKKNFVKIEEIWNPESLHYLNWASIAMSRARFQKIYSFLTFDEFEKRDDRKKTDKFYLMNDIFSRFRDKIRTAFEPGVNLCIDETLYKFRGRCQFKQYIPSKPAKYGIKLWSIVDVTTSYLLDTFVYLGKSIGSQKNSKEVGKNVVLHLVKPYFESGRTVTVDNFFTSIQLGKDLWEKGLFLVGTLRKNKKGIPFELLPSKEKEVFSSMHIFNSFQTMVSYVPKKNKAVILLSTRHHNEVIDYSNERNKPEIILHYNSNKGGVDTLDKSIEYYTCRRRTRKWTFNLFCYMLDVGSYNSFVLFQNSRRKQSFDKNISRSKFLEKLAIDLIHPHATLRFESFYKNNFQGCQYHIQESFIKLGFLNVTNVKIGDNYNNKIQQARCCKCPRSLDRKAQQRCGRCDQFICKNHSNRVTICKTCMENIFTENNINSQSSLSGPSSNLRNKH